MKDISFKRHRFPADVILYAVWLYSRFTLSLRDVGDLFAERGIGVARETSALPGELIRPGHRSEHSQDAWRR